MKISKRAQFVLFFLMLALCAWNIITAVPDSTEESYNISIIIRGKMDDSWSNLKKGAENAAEDLNVNLRFVAAIEGNTAEEQMELLQQEVDGTDAILISPVNKVLLRDCVQELAKDKPLILIESGISGENNIPIIQSDNVEMGRTLAKGVLDHGVNKKKILVLSGNEMCSSVKDRQKGFMEVMEETENDCSIISVGSFEPEAIYVLMKDRNPDVVVALDTAILENLVKANTIYKSNFPGKRVKIYGSGCSSTVLKALENNEIVAITASDSFSIGYLGVQEAVKAIEKKEASSNEDIRYILTDSELMYNDTHQKLLFPFVK